MSNLVIFGSNPATATGGASAVIQSYIDFIRRRFPRVKLSYVFYHDCVYDNAILRYKKMFAPFFWLLQNSSSKKTWICWWHSTAWLMYYTFCDGHDWWKTHSFIVTLHSPLYQLPKNLHLWNRVYRFLVASSGSTILYLNNFFPGKLAERSSLLSRQLKILCPVSKSISNKFWTSFNEVTSIPPITGEQLSWIYVSPYSGRCRFVDWIIKWWMWFSVAGDGPERKIWISSWASWFKA